MNIVNHALWGATIGRTVGMPVEGAVMGALPDLLMAPGFGYVWFKNGRHLDVETAPKWTKNIYAVLHNWWFGLILTGTLYLISRPLGILGLAYFLHIFIDAFVHRKMAVSFLWPTWNYKVKVYSAMEHKWIQAVDLALIIFINLYFFH